MSNAFAFQLPTYPQGAYSQIVMAGSIMIYQYGYTDFAKECVEAGYKINRVTTARNLFQSAVMQKDYNFVKYLLGKGLDPNLHFNGMPLERAVTDPKMLEILQGR